MNKIYVQWSNFYSAYRMYDENGNTFAYNDNLDEIISKAKEANFEIIMRDCDF